MSSNNDSVLQKDTIILNENISHNNNNPKDLNDHLMNDLVLNSVIDTQGNSYIENDEPRKRSKRSLPEISTIPGYSPNHNSAADPNVDVVIDMTKPPGERIGVHYHEAYNWKATFNRFPPNLTAPPSGAGYYAIPVYQ